MYSGYHIPDRFEEFDDLDVLEENEPLDSRSCKNFKKSFFYDATGLYDAYEE